MTSLAVDATMRLDQVHETGYWRVLIHPTVFEPQRIPTLADCWRVVDASRVSLRGWDYPQLNLAEKATGDDWVQSGSEWANHVELWRFYQSGQFVHHFSLVEDRDWPSLDWREYRPTKTTKTNHLIFRYALYTITEVFEFARGLAYRGVLDPSASVRIELHGMKGRRLVEPSHLNPLLKPYICHAESICWEKTNFAAAVLATAPELALEATTHVLNRFGWKNPSLEMLREDQRRLLERRL